MNATYFNKLDLSAKSFLVYKFGELVSFIHYFGFRIHLVIINGTYVEVFKNLLTDEIEKIELIPYEKGRFQLYAAPVNIQSLFHS